MAYIVPASSCLLLHTLLGRRRASVDVTEICIKSCFDMNACLLSPNVIQMGYEYYFFKSNKNLPEILYQGDVFQFSSQLHYSHVTLLFLVYCATVDGI